MTYKEQQELLHRVKTLETFREHQSEHILELLKLVQALQTRVKAAEERMKGFRWVGGLRR